MGFFQGFNHPLTLATARPSLLAAQQRHTSLAAFPSLFGTSSAPVISSYASTAVTFFTSTRIPAALIAGNSLFSLFSMSKQMRQSNDEKKNSDIKFNKPRFLALFLYHGLTLASLMLSLNVVVVSTAASNSLITGSYNPMATSAFEFLKREMAYEYYMVKWSFYVSILCFLQSTLCRALVEFDLLQREKWKGALLISLSINALSTNVLHSVNTSLYSFPNLGAMTVGILKVCSCDFCSSKETIS